jgi:RND family efflux transporter MFP subunit
MSCRYFVLSIALCICAQVAHAQEPAALVKLTKVERGKLHPNVTAFGTIAVDPDYLAAIALPRDGNVVAVSVRVGQLIHVGDPIATIETAPNAVASYQQAQSALSLAQKDLAHTSSLYKLQLATNAQLAAAEKSLSDARTQLQAQEKIGTNRQREVLRANAAGIVTAVNASPGERVQANTVVATIAARDRLLLNLGLEPEDALIVPVGAAVRLHSPQSEKISFNGQIESVDALMDPKSRLVNAISSVPPNIARQLVVGMVLVGTVQLPLQAGILIPKSALMTDKNGSYVFVEANRVAHRHNVQIVEEAGEQALVAKGVEAGAMVVVVGSAGLSDGTHVRLH